IVSIDGKTTRDMPEDQAVKTLRGKVGTPVEIKVGRLGVDEPMTFKIVREEIRINSVPVSYMIDNGIGYVELVGFREHSTEELKTAIEGLRAKGAKGLIIDLRRNPGGLLDQGITISDLFLPRGAVVAETKGRTDNMNQRAFAEDPDQFLGMPIVMLVGPGTASAAEILAGALQDHDRVLVVGRTSYGKGSVQSIFPMANKTFLKMTTARWYTPSGRSIQRPYGIGLSHAEGDTTQIDTLKKPAYKTDSGRTVLGGGGINPDITVKPDTLTVNERSFYELAQKQAQQYRNASFAYAVKYKKAHPNAAVNFQVTDAELNGFYDQLVAGGVKIPREVFDRARSAIAEDLAADIAYSLGGQEKWRERVNLRSPEIGVALQLLRKANSPQSLFNAAAQYQATQKTASAAPTK
ncbi:MAG TPA: S41 family peptidase, partial [Longimicrobiales bacterium]|nr:S41 family peptidase [Longimicrobiales bacterium]